MTLLYDPADRDVLRNPYALFARMRAEEPVHWSPKLSSWVVTSHAHAGTVLASDAFSSDRLSPFYKRSSDAERSTLSEVMRYIGLWLVFRNPPEHTRLRRLMNTAINPGIVTRMQPNINSIVHLLLDRIDTNGEFDFMSDFAVQLPAMVIMDMMGVPRKMLFTIKAFLLSRIIETRGTKPSEVGAEGDADRNEHVTLEIGPHPELSETQQKVIALDYGMRGGRAKIPVRKALLYYALKRLRHQLIETAVLHRKMSRVVVSIDMRSFIDCHFLHPMKSTS